MNFSALITIRQVRSEDWSLVKQIRLEALAEAPHAFLETLDEARTMPDEEWKERTQQNADGRSSTCWLAFVDERPVGIAVGLRGLRQGSPASLVSMWVAPDVRGNGLGRLLVEAVAVWARQTGASELLAEVTIENVEATEFYSRLGFERTGSDLSESENILLSLFLEPQVQATENRRVVRQFVNAINKRDWSRLEELVDPSFVRHSYAAGQSKVGSRTDLIRFLQGEFETFPDGRESILDLLTEGSRVAARHQFTGTQTRPMDRFPPSGKRLIAEYIAIYRLESGRIVEAWAEWDNLSSLMQLGHYRPEDL